MPHQLLVSTRKGLFELQNLDPQNKNNNWQIANTHFPGEPVSMVFHDRRDDTRYAALSLGHFGTKLHRSDDGGKNWQEISAPSYAGLGKTVNDQGEEQEPPSLSLIWCLEAGADNSLWCGTIPGGLFRSRDRGESWELMRSLWDDPLRAQWFGGGYDEPGIHSICVDPEDPRRLAVAVSCGGVWLSDDDGETWRVSTKGMRADFMPPDQADNPAIQDPHRMVQCPGSPEDFWVQHHNGIFRSRDRCQTWQEVKLQPSSFGFAVAVHPDNPDKAWFVPAIKDEFRYPVDGKLVVTRTTDSGESAEVLDNGLPGRDCYDLIYRHGLAVDETGGHLVMGSTTGNLWMSRDGGEHWHQFSSNLPPIYCVRFV